MVDKLKVINFLQDFGCATLQQLQQLYNAPNDNFKNILSKNIVSKKGDIFVHNTASIDNNMILALDVLCKYKDIFKQFYKGFFPINTTFLTTLSYNSCWRRKRKRNCKGINYYLTSIPKADRLILIFKDDKELENISCDIPFLYCDYALNIKNST